MTITFALNRKIKFLYLLLSALFCVQNCVIAQPLAPALEVPFLNQNSISWDKIYIPTDWGRIEKKSFTNSGKPFIIYLQDAHSIVDAQNSIQKLIDYFESKYGVNIVALEGGSGELDTKLFKSFPDRFVSQKVFNNYLQQGEITGGEMAAVFGKTSSKYYGIEDPKLYTENYQYYLQTVSNKEKVEKSIREFRQRLDEKRVSVYSKAFNDFHVHKQGFYEETVSFEKFIQVLKEQSRFLDPNEISQNYPELAKTWEGLANADDFSNEALSHKVVKIAQGFKGKYLFRLSHEKQKLWNEKYQTFQTGGITNAEYLKFLIENAREIQIHPKLSPELKHLLQGSIHLDSIKGTNLFNEIERMIDAVQSRFASEGPAQALAIQYDALKLLEDLNKLELTQKNWSKLQESSDSLKQVFPEIWDGLIAARSFYETAKRRDAMFHANLESVLNREKAKAAIVLTGGFHREGVEARLAEDEYSYVVITPKIKDLAGKDSYDRVMHQKVSYQKYLQGNYYEAFSRHASEKLVKDLNEPQFKQSLKMWRDNVIRDLASSGKTGNAREYTRFIDPLFKLYYEKYGMPVSAKAEKSLARELIETEFSAYRQKVIADLWSDFQNRFDVFAKGFKDLAENKAIDENSLLNLIDQSSIASASKLSPPLVLAKPVVPSLTGGPAAGRSEIRSQATNLQDAPSPSKPAQPVSGPASVIKTKDATIGLKANQDLGELIGGVVGTSTESIKVQPNLTPINTGEFIYQLMTGGRGIYLIYDTNAQVHKLIQLGSYGIMNSTSLNLGNGAIILGASQNDYLTINGKEISGFDVSNSNLKEHGITLKYDAAGLLISSNRGDFLVRRFPINREPQGIRALPAVEIKAPPLPLAVSSTIPDPLGELVKKVESRISDKSNPAIPWTVLERNKNPFELDLENSIYELKFARTEGIFLIQEDEKIYLCQRAESGLKMTELKIPNNEQLVIGRADNLVLYTFSSSSGMQLTNLKFDDDTTSREHFSIQKDGKKFIITRLGSNAGDIREFPRNELFLNLSTQIPGLNLDLSDFKDNPKGLTEKMLENPATVLKTLETFVKNKNIYGSGREEVPLPNGKKGIKAIAEREPIKTVVIGDIHGNLGGLTKLLLTNVDENGLTLLEGIRRGQVRVQFVGDLVHPNERPEDEDTNLASFACFLLVIALKNQFPKFVDLIPGNHETSWVFYNSTSEIVGKRIASRGVFPCDYHLFNALKEQFLENHPKILGGYQLAIQYLPTGVVTNGSHLLLHTLPRGEVDDLNQFNKRQPESTARQLDDDDPALHGVFWDRPTSDNKPANSLLERFDVPIAVTGHTPIREFGKNGKYQYAGYEVISSGSGEPLFAVKLLDKGGMHVITDASNVKFVNRTYSYPEDIGYVVIHPGQQRNPNPGLELRVLNRSGKSSRLEIPAKWNSPRINFKPGRSEVRLAETAAFLTRKQVIAGTSNALRREAPYQTVLSDLAETAKLSRDELDRKLQNYLESLTDRILELGIENADRFLESAEGEALLTELPVVFSTFRKELKDLIDVLILRIRANDFQVSESRSLSDQGPASTLLRLMQQTNPDQFSTILQEAFTEAVGSKENREFFEIAGLSFNQGVLKDAPVILDLESLDLSQEQINELGDLLSKLQAKLGESELAVVYSSQFEQRQKGSKIPAQIKRAKVNDGALNWMGFGRQFENALALFSSGISFSGNSFKGTRLLLTPELSRTYSDDYASFVALLKILNDRFDLKKIGDNPEIFGQFISILSQTVRVQRAIEASA